MSHSEKSLNDSQCKNTYLSPANDNSDTKAPLTPVSNVMLQLPALVELQGLPLTKSVSFSDKVTMHSASEWSLKRHQIKRKKSIFSKLIHMFKSSASAESV
jgi:hypothetical protein